MAKSKIPYESLSISDKIEVKRKKIQRLFRDLPAERKQFADGLIYQFAVSYNTTIKSFTSLSKSLLDLLPEKTQKQAGEELMNFATKPAGAGKR